MRCRTALLFLVIAAQTALLFWAHGATKVMREEWPHIVKASPSRVYVIQHDRFWGPVNAIVPKRCREIDKWQGITDTEDEAPAFPSPIAPAGPWTTPAPSDGVASTAEEPGQPPQPSTTWQGWQDQQPGVPAPTPPFLRAGAAPQGPRWPTPPPPLETSTTAWTGTLPGSPPVWLPPAPAVVSTTFTTFTVPRLQAVQTLMQTAAQSSDPTTKQALLTGLEDVPHEEMLRSERGAASLRARRLEEVEWDVIDGDDIALHRCNETMHFEGVTHLHRYLSMISLSNHISGPTLTAEQLHNARIRGHNSLLFAIVACMILKYSLKVTDICAECWGHQYVQLWNQGRTTFDKFLESLLLHGVSIIFTLALQMTLCGLFLTFWREDHFIMTYIPGLGFSLFFGSLVVFCVFMVVDRLRGWMARCRNSYIYCFWFIWLLWMALLTVPMIGYCIYSVQFMWRVRQMGWLQDQDQMFSKEFVQASVTVARATACFVVVAVVDMVVILLQDQDQMFSKEFVHASVTAARATGCFVLVAVVDFVVILMLDLDQHQAQNGNTH